MVLPSQCGSSASGSASQHAGRGWEVAEVKNVSRRSSSRKRVCGWLDGGGQSVC